MARWIVFFLMLLNISLAQADLSKKSITIGTLQFYPPFEVVTSQNIFFGFEIDVILNICTQAKISCHIKTFLFDELFKQIENGGIDLAIASIINSDDRKHQFLFSNPYLPSYIQFLTRKESNINSLADLHGKKIGTVDDPIFQDFLYKNYANTNTIYNKFYPTLDPGLSDLQEGNIDVFLLDKMAADYWIANNGQQFKSIGPKIQIGFGYAIMANKNNIALIKLINGALSTMENDGDLLKIYKKYLEEE